MTFTAPLGLLALLAIPAIITIHLFRRRFPERRVAGLFLWQMARQTPEGGGRRSTLPITTSLVLECLAALALGLIIAGTRVSSAGTAAHLVVLLDDSASMSATDSAGRSARDRAIDRVMRELDRLGSAARVSLITSGERPAVIAGPAAYAIEARNALQAWTPAAPNHSLALGIRLARELAGDSGQVLIVSDLPPAARGEGDVQGALWAAVGIPLPNVGIVAAERTVLPEEGRGAISLTFANESDRSERRRLEIVTAGATTEARDLDIPAGVSSIRLPLEPGLPAARVTLSKDALTRDNEVTLVEPRPRIVAVANHLREGRGRQALSKALAALSGITTADPGHLAFEEARLLESAAAPDVWRVGIGHPPAAWTAAGDGSDFLGPFVIEKRHPLLLGVTLGGVVWAGAVPTRPGSVRPLVSAGNRVLVATPGAQAHAAVTDVLLNLDLDRTNLVRSPDWPILISNLVEMRRQSLPGPERWNYRVGEWIRVRLGHEPKGPLRYRCGAIERSLPNTSDLEFLAPSPGGLLSILEGDTVLFELGVNFFDATESNLREQATSDAGALTNAPGLRGERGAASDPLFWLLLAVATAAILANWFVLAPRRRTA